MHQLGIEEKAALLIPTDGDDNEELNNSIISIPENNLPVIRKRRKKLNYSRNRNSILCFTLIIIAFIVGCVTGIITMLYRIGQDTEQYSLTSHSTTTIIIESIQKNLFQSIVKDKFVNFNKLNENEIDRMNELFAQWKSLSPELTQIKQFLYDIELSQSISSKQWNGIELIDEKLIRNDRFSAQDIRSFPSLIHSGRIDSQAIYYVNYGREEDFAYLFRFRILWQNQNQSIVFMRKNSAIISQIEQIRQAIHYGFSGLILFDDNDQNQQITTTNDRHSFYQEWLRQPTPKDRENYLNGTFFYKNQSIPFLILSSNDVRKIFESVKSDTDSWLNCPLEWHNKSTSLKIGGILKNFQLRFISNVENIKIQLPVIMSSIQSDIEPDRFIMIGSKLSSTQQNQILNQLIQAYLTQIKNGWKPKRSILFCAWSAFDYDQYPIRRWLMDNKYFIENNLLTYIDLGNGILSESTLNLHGSPLLEQIAHHAADAVTSPLQHDHNCHHRQMTTTTTTPMSMENNDDDHHHHGRKRRDNEHDHHMDVKQEEECEPHKLLDEWIRASRNRLGLNETFPIVQTIDGDSTAALFQLQYGIPSILIEMTNEQALNNDTFYVHHGYPIFDDNIRADVYVAYTQFICEFIRQLIDQSLIPFNLTDYAKQIDRYVNEYLIHYGHSYYSLSYHLGSRDEFSETFYNLTKKMREIQIHINQLSQNDLISIESFNKKLIDFERLLINNEPLIGMNSPEKIYKHVLIGPAFGLTHTVVPFPYLSNILYNIPDDPPSEICDGSKIFWLKLKEHIHLINRILNGLNGLLSKK